MKYTIKNILLFLAGVAFLVPAAYMAFRVLGNIDAAQETAAAEFEKITLKAARLCVEDAARVCQIIYKTDTAAYEGASAAVREAMQSLGTAQSGAAYVMLDAYAQNSPEKISRHEIPAMSFGETPVAPAKDAFGNAVAKSAAIDKAMAAVKRDALIDVSLMGKINEAGTMMRLATTLRRGGKPMVGSIFDDTPETSEITRALLARRTYFGVMRIGPSYYVCAYEPIIDRNGEVAGAVEFLKSFANMKFVFDNFETIRIGEDGYLWGFMADAGKAVKIKNMRQPKFDGRQPDDARGFGDNQEDMQAILDTALAAGDGKVTVKKAGSAGGETITAYTYFKPWNIVIGATINENDFDIGEKRLDADIEKAGSAVMPALAVLFVCALAFAARAGGAMGGAVESVLRAINAMQSANETAAIRELSEKRRAGVVMDEIEKLRQAAFGAADSILGIVGKIKAETADFSKSADNMFERAAQIEKTSEKKTAKLADIQNALALISKTAKVLDGDAKAAVAGIDSSLAEMKGGANLLLELEENARMLIADAQNVALQLSIIKDKADRISMVVNTIKAVSERINTLSVNASIEAERTGETSIGFKSVAVEITKLSDTTAVSAMRISEMASAMCKSVNSGVGEMKDFSAIMQGCKESIRNARETVSAAQATTLGLSPKFGELSKGIAAHSENIASIGENLGKLSARSADGKYNVARLKYRASTITATAAAIKLKLKNFDA